MEKQPDIKSKNVDEAAAAKVTQSQIEKAKKDMRPYLYT